MLLTRSIRRKLTLGLALVVILLLFSTLSSISGVASYYRMVRDLELSIENSPRRDELIATLSLLIHPLSVEFPHENRSSEDRRRAAEWQHLRFVQVFEQVKSRVQDFERKWQRLPDPLAHNTRQQVPFRTLFITVDEQLAWIESGMHRLADPSAREEQVRETIRRVGDLIHIAGQVPDPSNRLGERLHEARSDYLFHLRLVTCTGLMSVGVLIVLILWGHRLIFRPIKRLSQGVKRIADGDFNYRLNVETECEISHLANAFNQLVARVQEDRKGKEREIAERSKQLVLSERLAGAGFLASGVAHEINNPLSVIMTAAYGLESRLTGEILDPLPPEDRKDVVDYLQMIQSEAERCERITHKLLDFSYGKSDERNLYDVTAIAEEVIGMVGHLSRYQDRNLSLDSPVPLSAWINAPEIKQVILNLVANALDATEPGGHVTVALREYPDEIELSVEDDGCGMTPEQMKNIFEPFFTTKDVGKGTGLGLSITHRIVKDHGGTLEVSSPGPGAGSRFALRLPKATRRVRAA